jgi:hypothetical protein
MSKRNIKYNLRSTIWNENANNYIPITVPKKYRTVEDNGLFELDVAPKIKLLSYANLNSKKELMASGQQMYNLKNKHSAFFSNMNAIPNFHTNNNIQMIDQNIILSNDDISTIRFDEEMRPYTGTYILNLTITHGPVFAGVYRDPVPSDNWTQHMEELYLGIHIHYIFRVFHPGDKIKIEVDTKRKVIKIYVNYNQIEKVSYNDERPLHFRVFISRNHSIQIDSLQHIFENSNLF